MFSKLKKLFKKEKEPIFDEDYFSDISKDEISGNTSKLLKSIDHNMAVSMAKELYPDVEPNDLNEEQLQFCSDVFWGIYIALRWHPEVPDDFESTLQETPQ